MDPRETLRQIREIYRATLSGDEDTDSTLYQLSELVEGLDGWMTRDGYSPWARQS